MEEHFPVRKDLIPYIRAYESLGDAVTISDSSDRLVFINSAGEELYGYDRRELVGRPLSTIFPEGSQFVDTATLLASPNEEWKGEVTRSRKSGEKFPAQMTVTLLRNEDDEVIGTAGIVRDLTEQRRLADENAVLAEVGRITGSALDIGEIYERFADEVRTLIPSDRISITSVDADQDTAVIVFYVGKEVPGAQSAAPNHLAGSFMEKVVSPPTGMLLCGEEMEEVASKDSGVAMRIEAGLRSCMFVPLVSNDRVVGVITFRSTDPNRYTERQLELARRVSVQIAGAIANAQLHRDLQQEAEERRLAQVALTQSEERNRAIVQAIPDLIFRVRGDGTFLDFRGGNDEFSLPPEVWLGKRQSEVMPPDVAELAMRSIKLAILTGQVQEFEYTLPVPMPDGEVRDWEGRAVKAGEDEVLILARDITDRKRPSAELLQAQNMDALGTLAGGVAHDFNNMLTAITGYTGLAAVTPGIPGHVRDYLEDVRKAADRAAGLTRQLLAFSRRHIVSPKIIDLNDIIFDIDKMLRRLIREDIELVTQTAENLRLVRSDPGHIEQVLMNLAVNASDAMPEGGTLFIETLNVMVDDEFASQHADLASGDYVGLTVRDTGEGMTKETQSRVFEPFFTTKPESTEGRPWGQSLKKPSGAPLNLG